MRIQKLFTICLLGLTYLVTAGNEGCAIRYSGEAEGNSFPFAIQPQVIADGGILGGVLTQLGITFPFESAFPSTAEADEKVTEIYLNEFALRSTRSDDFGSDGQPIESQLTDPNRVGDCVANQKNLNFIKKLEVYLQKEGSTGAPTRIASYVRPASNPTTCGFFLALDKDPATGKLHNLKKFMPKFTVSTKAEGTAPSTPVEVTGYVRVDWVVPSGEIVIPPQDKDEDQK